MILDNEFTGDPRVENEVQALQSAGHEVFVLCLNYGSKEATEQYHGAQIVRLAVNKWIFKKLKGLNNTVFDFYPNWWCSKIETFCKNKEIEHLYIHDLWMLNAGLKANKKLRLPITVDLHENFVFALGSYKYANTFPGNILISQEKWRRDEDKWLSKVDSIVVVIEEAKARLVGKGFAPEKITVVPNYVNIGEYSQEDVSLTKRLQDDNKGKNVLTYTGGFDVHRGLDVLLKSVPAVKTKVKDFRLKLVGGGSNESDLKQLASDLKILDVVDFVGYRPHRELPSYVKASDICIIPHLKTKHTDNTIPHKLFQYMLMGKPVVASNCVPIKRIVDSVGCGFIYQYDQPESCANAIIAAFSSDQNQLGMIGKQAVLSEYNWRQASRKLVELFGKR